MLGQSGISVSVHLFLVYLFWCIALLRCSLCVCIFFSKWGGWVCLVCFLGVSNKRIFLPSVVDPTRPDPDNTSLLIHLFSYEKFLSFSPACAPPGPKRCPSAAPHRPPPPLPPPHSPPPRRNPSFFLCKRVCVGGLYMSRPSDLCMTYTQNIYIFIHI